MNSDPRGPRINPGLTRCCIIQQVIGHSLPLSAYAKTWRCPVVFQYLSKISIPSGVVKQMAFEIDVCGFRKGEMFPDLGYLADELVSRHPLKRAKAASAA